MVWQEAFPPTGGPAFDAEAERERRLAAQARAGADWALTALIARYQPTVVRYLTRLCGNQAQARRLAERIFQRMERRLHGPHGGDNLRLWLLRACTEAGLDALRRPRSRSAPRLTGASVAGLLTEQTGDDYQGVVQGGLRRLRRAANGVSRQARPLVWANDPAAIDTATASDQPAQASSESHLDEALDRLEPAEALRHRLVRVTLAELPYGDAQCLALHLVAGLNQAEVAKALGITNSAARKRVVHGLALFSDRYGQAVQSLGLPVELGFGDALPRAPEAPEPIAEPAPAPAPVVVSSKAPGAPDAAERPEGEDRLIAANPSSDQGRDALSGVSYLSDDSGESEAMPLNGASDPYPDMPYAQASAARRPTHPPVAVTFDDAPEAMNEPLIATQDPAPVSGGLITRVASDAIIGPIVDALPVTDSPEASGSFGTPALRSMPLAYELSSHQTPAPTDQSQASSIRVNWLDDSGLMAPLSFEAVAVSTLATSAETQPTADDAPLAFEASATPMAAAQEDGAPTDDAPLAFELAQAAADEDEPVRAGVEEISAASEGQTSDESLQAGDDEPLALVAEPTPPEPVTVPVLAVHVGPHAEPVVEPVVEPAAPDGLDDSGEPEAPPFIPRSTSVTRSLEDIWDELSDGADI